MHLLPHSYQDQRAANDRGSSRKGQGKNVPPDPAHPIGNIPVAGASSKAAGGALSPSRDVHSSRPAFKLGPGSNEQIVGCPSKRARSPGNQGGEHPPGDARSFGGRKEWEAGQGPALKKSKKSHSASGSGNKSR